MKGIGSLKPHMGRLVFDTGPFLMLFTREDGSDTARRIVLMHERGELEVYMHPFNLAEAYRVIARIRSEKPSLLVRDVTPGEVVRSAYATLRVVSDVETTIALGALKQKYPSKPWGDLSSAALSLRLSAEGVESPVVILDGEKHFEGISEVKTVRISELENTVLP